MAKIVKSLPDGADVTKALAAVAGETATYAKTVRINAKSGAITKKYATALVELIEAGAVKMREIVDAM